MVSGKGIHNTLDLSRTIGKLFSLVLRLSGWGNHNNNNKETSKPLNNFSASFCANCILYLFLGLFNLLSYWSHRLIKQIPILIGTAFGILQPKELLLKTTLSHQYSGCFFTQSSRFLQMLNDLRGQQKALPSPPVHQSFLQGWISAFVFLADLKQRYESRERLLGDYLEEAISGHSLGKVRHLQFPTDLRESYG